MGSETITPAVIKGLCRLIDDAGFVTSEIYSNPGLDNRYQKGFHIHAKIQSEDHIANVFVHEDKIYMWPFFGRQTIFDMIDPTAIDKLLLAITRLSEQIPARMT